MSVRYTTSVLAQTACIWEVTARKLGNVHRYTDFHDTSYLDFVSSALALDDGIWLAETTQAVGGAVRMAASDTRSLVGKNTNLGIILLIVPLATIPGAWQSENPPGDDAFDLRSGIRKVLNGLTVDDAREVYQAIRLAKPGGLGDAPEQDVREEPTVTLLEAMQLAADRDMVARQYANGYADVFDFGVPAFLSAFERFGCVEAAIVDSQLRWLAAYPDSLIARKNGAVVAAEVQQRAAEVLQLGGIDTPEGRRAGVELDRHLRSDGNKLNPGTTADLITACLFVALRENKIAPSAPFAWRVPDWLKS